MFIQGDIFCSNRTIKSSCTSRVEESRGNTNSFRLNKEKWKRIKTLSRGDKYFSTNYTSTTVIIYVKSKGNGNKNELCIVNVLSLQIKQGCG